MVTCTLERIATSIFFLGVVVTEINISYEINIKKTIETRKILKCRDGMPKSMQTRYMDDESKVNIQAKPHP